MRATSLAVGLAILLSLSGRALSQTKHSVLEQLKVQKTTPHHLDPVKRALLEPVMALYHADTIGLTEEQRKAIEKELKEARVRFGVLERKLETENHALFELIDDPETTEQMVTVQMERVLAAEREIKLANLQSSWRVRRLLTEQQRERLMGLALPPPPPPPPPPGVPPAPLRHGVAPAAPR